MTSDVVTWRRDVLQSVVQARNEIHQDFAKARTLPERRALNLGDPFILLTATNNEEVDVLSRSLGFQEAFAGMSFTGTAYVLPLFRGLAGLAWLFQSFPSMSSLQAPHEAVLEFTDALLIEKVSAEGLTMPFDLVAGLSGLGVYGLARLPRPNAVRLLELIVDALEALASKQDRGLAWPTLPRHLPAHKGPAAHSGYFDLGVAHGTPGPIGLLARIVQSGVAGRRAVTLLDGGVEWLLGQRRTYDSGIGYPNSTSGTSERPRGRTAWCYGTLGVAAALLSAGLWARRPRWQDDAVDLALSEARRPVAEAGVVDASLCHGAAGAAHLFQLFFEVTNDNTFFNRSEYWYDMALGMRRPGEGVGGYTFGRQVQGRGHTEIIQTGKGAFLSGTAGVSAGLASLTTMSQPVWRRLLLIDVPSPSSGIRDDVRAAEEQMATA